MTTLFLNNEYGLIDKAHCDFTAGFKHKQVKCHPSSDAVVYFVGRSTSEQFEEYCNLVKEYIFLSKFQLLHTFNPNWVSVEDKFFEKSKALAELIRPFCGVQDDSFYIQSRDANWWIGISSTTLIRNDLTYTESHKVPYISGTGGNLALSGWCFGMTPTEITEFVSTHDPFSSSPQWADGWDIFYRKDLKPINFKHYFPELVKGLA